MQVSGLAKARRRRKIRLKLEEVARVVSSPRTAHPTALALFSEADCAIITEGGEIIVTKTGSTRPFENVAPNMRAIRAAAARLAGYFGEELQVVHVRGKSGLLHAYVLGRHTLVTVTEVSPGARGLDAVVERVDECLGVGGEGRTLIEELGGMLEEF